MIILYPFISLDIGVLKDFCCMVFRKFLCIYLLNYFMLPRNSSENSHDVIKHMVKGRFKKI